MLDDIRVLEISAPETMTAGRILADLGADVVVVEPPAGAPGRRLEPFLGDIPGLERSLTWHALNRNKRAITLDVNSPDGREIVAALAAKFDIILETKENALADSIDLGSRTIRCTVAPFAKTGPKSDYAASDFIVTASSGAPAMTGDPDRPPLFFAVPQAMMEAGAEAAIAALSALAARDRDGAGQSVEVSARLAAMMPSFGQPIILGSGNREIPRAAVRNTIAGVDIPSAWECADGFVLITIAFGAAFGPMTQRLVKWAADEGHVPARLADKNWVLTPGDPAGGVSPDDLRTTVNGLRALCLMKKKNEVADAARRLGILASPIFDMRDIAESPQYRGRGLWTPIEIELGKMIDAPARFAQFSNFSIETRRPAPKLSEHTAAILAEELGFSALEIQALFVHGVI